MKFAINIKKSHGEFLRVLRKLKLEYTQIPHFNITQHTHVAEK